MEAAVATPMTSVQQECNAVLDLIECALAHPVLPEGQHVFNRQAELAPGVIELYPLVFKLYTEVSQSRAFRELYDAFGDGNSAYYKIIVSPMSLRCVLDRIEQGRYSQADQVQRDLDLIWANCEKYNGSTSPLTTEARYCQQWFRNALAAQRDNAPAEAADIKALVEFLEANYSDEVAEKLTEFARTHLPACLNKESDLELSHLKHGEFVKLRDFVTGMLKK